MTARRSVELRGGREHDMLLIRVLQQVNTTACNWDCPREALLGRTGICTIAEEPALLHTARRSAGRVGRRLHRSEHQLGEKHQLHWL